MKGNLVKRVEHKVREFQLTLTTAQNINVYVCSAL
jgi:hypothetical protein